MSNSTYHGVAKWLGELLQPLHKMVVSHSVKDVFEFIANVDDINVNGKQMLSLDVASLFTNVPLMETVEFICQQILEKQIDIGIPVSSLKELLLRCTMNVHFIFNNLYYRQIDGIAMGSPLGPILADFFLAKIENGPLKKVIEKADSYFRYVDDTFIILDVK
uniref:Reverse transcriptase domain-containing protein n=1 Tax=Trichobilharzia regenti TaxID=157069 RepID=A0AA85J392_TRIRE